MAGLPFRLPANGFRHSFGSYPLAMHDDAALTAREMGHMSTSMVYGHYDNHQVIKEEAERYFSIRPLDAEKVVAMAV